jgi:putative hemolysin
MTWGDFLASQGWKLPVLLILLGMSAALSAAETALFKLSAGQLYRMRTSDKPLQRLVASLMRTPRRTLNTLLLANLLVNTLYSAMSAVLVVSLERSGLLPLWAVGLASLLPALGLILLAEAAPKSLAYAAETWVAQAVAIPLSAMNRALAPVVWVLERAVVAPLVRVVSPRGPGGKAISSSELSAVLELSVKRGLIGHDANELLQEIVELPDLRAADVMVPRVDMVAFDVNDPPRLLLETFRHTRLRKVPVYDGDLDNILGLVHAKRLLLESERPIRELVTPVVYVPEAANLERLLLQFRVKRMNLAIVVDEFGGTAGLVTLEDVLEEIVGEIPDAHSMTAPAAVEKVSEREYVVDGELAIHEWVEAFKIDVGAHRISTIGGFVTSLLGRIPRQGDVAEYRNLRFVVETMRRRRVGKLRLTLLEGRQ